MTNEAHERASDANTVLPEARSEFVAAFPLSCHSLGVLIDLIVSSGPRGVLPALRQLVDRLAAEAGQARERPAAALELGQVVVPARDDLRHGVSAGSVSIQE